MRRLPAADRRGRGGRRGARQRAGAAARARVGRVRRPLREPDARPRARGRGRRARDGAAVHAGPGRPQVRRGGRRARRTSSTGCRSCSARCTARSLPCAPRSPGGGSRTSRWAAARCPSRSRTPCARCKERGLLGVGDRGRAVPRRRRRLRHDGRRASPGPRADGYDAVVCAVGPGIVGTGTRFGHGALALADAANVGGGARRPAGARGPHVRGRPARAPPRRLASRRSGPRPVPGRGRRRLARRDATDGWEEACAGLPLSHMGRGPEEDPAFFRAAFAAGVVARGMLA